MGFLTPSERRTLEAVCDTFAPALTGDTGLMRASAADLKLAAAVEDALLLVADDARRSQLCQVLRLLENDLFNGLTTGQWAAFSDLDLEGRTAILRAWGNSRFLLARQAFQGFKRLILYMFYTLTPPNAPNPTWEAIHYQPPPLPLNGQPRPIKPLEIYTPTTLYTDVLVIGSGAGGGVVAAEMTAAGQDVIVVEKGPYYHDSDFNGRELDSMATLFEHYGSFSTADLSVNVLAGSTLGGGTTINWSASLRTPDYVLREWEEGYGFSDAAGKDFQHSLDAVVKRINASTDESHVNGNNAALERGCKALGYDVTAIPRNVKGCEECGFCNFGCAYGAKQGTLKTFLQDAHDRGARILVNAYVQRVLHQRGVALGAEVSVPGRGRSRHTVTIRAKRVVVAAGSLHTPALLLRSGLTNAHIGANLHLHPVTVIYGLFDEPVAGWQGPPMTRLTGKFANLDGQGYGVRLETAPVHPGLAALSLSWQSGAQHRRTMSQLDHLANVIVLTRDRFGGHITVDSRGEPVLHYSLHSYDARHMMRGTLEALRIHVAAGAYEVASPHNNQLVFHPREEPHGLQAFLDAVEARGFQPNAYTLSSAHQMSSCRVGGNSALGAVDPSGETYEVRNLYVADGSALPTASGVNPMVTIMGTAHFLAQQIKTQL